MVEWYDLVDILIAQLDPGLSSSYVLSIEFACNSSFRSLDLIDKDPAASLSINDLILFVSGCP